MRTKLLVAFAVIAALLVAVGVLGLRVLGQSNARVESLGTLQLRAATYQSLQTQAQQLRQLLAVRAAAETRASAPTSAAAPAGRARAAGAGSRRRGDRRCAVAARPGDERVAVRVRASARGRGAARAGSGADYTRASRRTLDRMIMPSDRNGGRRARRASRFLTRAISLDNDLGALTDQLAATTRAQTDALIAQNRELVHRPRATSSSGSASAASLLALLLGFVLSWSVVEPIQRTEARLAEIAARRLLAARRGARTATSSARWRPTSTA